MAGTEGRFGEQLRTERERLGISLETLCAQTKVQRRHLAALEESNFAALPGGVIRKGIVRAYLHSAGLAEDEWLPRFEQSLYTYGLTHGDTMPATGAWETFAENVRRNRAGARESNPLRWLGVALLVVALAVAAWAVWRYLLVRP